ncbi:MAG TPA: hypothetical protein VFO89_15975 [Thermoanaerobaculia bacterium]|nr:hypothetical protein [Thermoanaerobaculia bacterium]
MTETLAARVSALAPEQLSLLVLRLRDHLRGRAHAGVAVPADIDIDQLSDGAVEELLAQLLAADGEAAAAVAAAPRTPDAPVDVDELSDDEVAAMLATMLPTMIEEERA